MSDITADAIDPRRVIAEIPLDNLPRWLAKALDLISRNIELFPPIETDGFEMLEHLYPH